MSPKAIGITKDMKEEMEKNKRFLRVMGISKLRQFIGKDGKEILSIDDIEKRLSRLGPHVAPIAHCVVKDYINQDYIIKYGKKDAFLYYFEQVNKSGEPRYQLKSDFLSSLEMKCQ